MAGSNQRQGEPLGDRGLDPARAVEMQGGTTCRFVTDGIESALERATAAANPLCQVLAESAEQSPTRTQRLLGRVALGEVGNRA